MHLKKKRMNKASSFQNWNWKPLVCCSIEKRNKNRISSNIEEGAPIKAGSRK